MLHDEQLFLEQGCHQQLIRRKRKRDQSEVESPVHQPRHHLFRRRNRDANRRIRITLAQSMTARNISSWRISIVVDAESPDPSIAQDVIFLLYIPMISRRDFALT